MLSQQLACRKRNIHYWEAMGTLQKFSLMLTLLWMYFHWLVLGSRLFCVSLIYLLQPLSWAFQVLVCRFCGLFVKHPERWPSKASQVLLDLREGEDRRLCCLFKRLKKPRDQSPHQIIDSRWLGEKRFECSQSHLLCFEALNSETLWHCQKSGKGVSTPPPPSFYPKWDTGLQT